MTILHRILVSLGIIALTACGSQSVPPAATVHFVLYTSNCSSRFPVQFSIDNVQVGTDTFIVNLPQPHTESAGFATSDGSHTLGARIVGGLIWPDLTVTLTAGQVFLDSLPVSCS
jgi:hypothetical protein